MEDLKLVCRVLPCNNSELIAYQPARDISTLTVGQVVKAFRNQGSHDFVREFDSDFEQLTRTLDDLEQTISTSASTLIAELEVPNRALTVRT